MNYSHNDLFSVPLSQSQSVGDFTLELEHWILARMGRPFLTAEWRYLAMLNFVADPAVLESLVPAGTELDFCKGETFLSVVGFRFLNTKVLGCAIPFHRHFEEVNLRFYVRRQTAEGWRRGVVFIRELVPRVAIAFVARVVYGEPYVSLPMRHKIDLSPSGIHVEYGWRRRGEWESINISSNGAPRPIENGSHEEFITEHYWGYTTRGHGCREYQVEHPRWNFWTGEKSQLNADVATLYDERFTKSLSSSPASTLIADGSPVIVRPNSEIARITT